MSTNPTETTARGRATNGVWISLIAAIAIGLIVGACAVQSKQGALSGEVAPASRSDTAAQPAQPGAGAPPAEPGPGDSARGRQVFQALACNSCHAAPGMGGATIGPPLTNIAMLAATRRPGYSAGQYLVESITHPNDFITAGYQPNVMPATYGNLQPGQLNDLVAYLLSLK